LRLLYLHISSRKYSYRERNDREAAWKLPVAGPGAETVLVFETPAGNTNLQSRIAAHAALLRMLVTELVSQENR